MQSYILSPEVYNAPRALLFGICSEHFSKAIHGAGFGHKFVHFTIGFIESIPVIGQVTALFEKMIAERAIFRQMRQEAQPIIDQVEQIYRSAVEGHLFALNSRDPEYLRQQPAFKELRDRIKRTPNPFFTSEILRKIKELASCPELIEAREALKMGIQPELMSNGISGSYVLLGRNRQKLGIFKPGAQEPGAAGNPKGFRLFNQNHFNIKPGTGYFRERVAYLLDKKGHFAGVPLTKIAQFEKRNFPCQHDSFVPNQLEGSFQTWVDNTHVAYQDYQILPSWFSRAHGNKIPASEIHKIAIFDLRTLNCDRHLQNFLVAENLQTIYPIDHGFILPGHAKSLRFDWINFSQAKKPFSREALDYIEQLDPDADCALIQKKVPDVSQDTLKMVKISSLLLKIAARKGLTAYQIADLYMRRSHEGLLNILNKFLPIPSNTPSYFEREIWGVVKSNPHLNLEAFLEERVEQYLKG